MPAIVTGDPLQLPNSPSATSSPDAPDAHPWNASLSPVDPVGALVDAVAGALAPSVEALGLGVLLGVGVVLALGVGAAVGVALTVGVGVAVGVALTVGVGVALGVGAVLGVGVVLRLGVGEGLAVAVLRVGTGDVGAEDEGREEIAVDGVVAGELCGAKVGRSATGGRVSVAEVGGAPSRSDGSTELDLSAGRSVAPAVVAADADAEADGAEADGAAAGMSAAEVSAGDAEVSVRGAGESAGAAGAIAVFKVMVCTPHAEEASADCTAARAGAAVIPRTTVPALHVAPARAVNATTWAQVRLSMERPPIGLL